MLQNVDPGEGYYLLGPDDVRTVGDEMLTDKWYQVVFKYDGWLGYSYKEALGFTSSRCAYRRKMPPEYVSTTGITSYTEQGFTIN